MSKYYPGEYYNFNCRSENLIKRVAQQLRAHYAIFNKGGLVGKLIYNRFPNEALRSLSRIKLIKDLKILDVGCGFGNLLYTLRELDFENLLGIDPCIGNDIHYENGLRIFKKNNS